MWPRYGYGSIFKDSVRRGKTHSYKEFDKMMKVDWEMVANFGKQQSSMILILIKSTAKTKHAQKREEDVFPFGCSGHVGGQTRGCLFTDPTPA